MTSTDTIGAVPPSPRPTATPPRRLLRRSRTDRVGAGVAGGLGEYFSVDPVLFRVLFATSAFFGGAGILAYMLAWIAIPETGTENATVDRWIRGLRRRRIPFWLAAALGAILFWAVAFSWWAPGPVFPVMVVVLVFLGFFIRRGATQSPASPAASTVSLEKDEASTDTVPDAAPGTPRWVGETRQWMAESRDARRLRRNRAMPLRITTLALLFGTLIVLGLVDAASGIAIPVYFYVSLGIVGAGLLVGMILRRTPWSVLPLLIPSIAGTIAFAGSHASLHDGVGQREWKPTTTVSGTYKLAFGQGVLDLRSLPAPTGPTTVQITMAGGQVKIIAPKTLNMVVDANIRFGRVEVDGSSNGDTRHGVGLSAIIDAPENAKGSLLTIVVHLADGEVSVEHV